MVQRKTFGSPCAFYETFSVLAAALALVGECVADVDLILINLQFFPLRIPTIFPLVRPVRGGIYLVGCNPAYGSRVGSAHVYWVFQCFLNLKQDGTALELWRCAVFNSVL